MIRSNRVRKALAEGKTVFGPFVRLGSEAAMEVIGRAGFDFAIIDMEHGPLSVETAENLVRTAELTGIVPIIRVTDNEPAKIARALDSGAYGVQVPHVNSVEEAEKAVRAAKFAPQGARGLCRFVRAAQYSALDRYQYLKMSNENIMTIVMLEGQEGIDSLEAILSVPGIDVIFIGPYDLSQSLGVTGQVNHPIVVDKVKEITVKALAKGKVVGSFADTLETAYYLQELRLQFIAYSTDVGILYETVSQLVHMLRKRN